MQKKTIAVFFGGNSNEHEVSVITGMFAVNLLRTSDYRVVPVYLPRAGGMMTGAMHGVNDFRGESLKKFMPVALLGRDLVRVGRRKKLASVDVALNCCHGGAGEDGTLSALLAWNGIANASPSLAVSSLFMDKTLSKIAARGLGIPVLPSVDVREADWGEEKSVLARVKKLGYPVVVKPARLGSSIGVTVVRSAKELPGALELAFRLDDGALVERYLAGKRDLNCAACRVDGKTVLSPVEEVFSGEDILTFSEKYEGKELRRSALPADIPDAIAEAVSSYTKLLYESFHTCGVVRADFLLEGDKVYFNELNTVPGSLSCYLFGETLSEAKNFLLSLVEEAIKFPPAKKETLVTGILEEAVFSRGKGAKRRH